MTVRSLAGSRPPSGVVSGTLPYRRGVLGAVVPAVGLGATRNLPPAAGWPGALPRRPHRSLARLQVLVEEAHGALPRQSRGVGVKVNVGADREVEQVIGAGIGVDRAGLTRREQGAVQQPRLLDRNAEVRLAVVDEDGRADRVDAGGERLGLRGAAGEGAPELRVGRDRVVTDDGAEPPGVRRCELERGAAAEGETDDAEAVGIDAGLRGEKIERALEVAGDQRMVGAPVGAEIVQREEVGGQGDVAPGRQRRREGFEVGTRAGDGMENEHARKASGTIGGVEVPRHLALASGVVDRADRDALGLGRRHQRQGQRASAQEEDEPMTQDHSITRRAMLRTLGALGAAATTGALVTGAPRIAGAQQLGRNETVEEAMKRVFGGKPIKDGSSVIKLEIPLIAENGAVVPVSVSVDSPMTPTNYVKHIYIVADKNRIPIVTRVALAPEAGRAFLGANIRLGETGDVRAIVEQSDGTLLQVKREVKVTVGGCGG